jgi:hypothetical protein
VYRTMPGPFGKSSAHGAARPSLATTGIRYACFASFAWLRLLGASAQPLAGNGLPLGRVLLVDNEARKAAPGEADCVLLLPTWEHEPGWWAVGWLCIALHCIALHCIALHCIAYRPDRASIEGDGAGQAGRT